MMQVTDVEKAIKEFRRAEKPILAVCAGMILARQGNGRACENRIHLDLLPVTIDNNELNGVYDVTGYENKTVFSNGPVARPLGHVSEFDSDVWTPGVRVLSRIRATGQHQRKVVAVQAGSCLGFAFHQDIYGRFLEQCQQ